MKEVMVIEGIEIERIEYQGQPVLSLPMVDEVHKRPKGTAKRNFGQNRERFILEQDYYELPYEEWSNLVERNSSHQGDDSSHQKEAGGHRGSMIFLTLSGYLILAKSFTDDLAWVVQRILVDSYFQLKELQSIAKDLIALKAKADSAEEWKNKYLQLHEEVFEIFKRKVIKKPPLTRDEIERMKQMYAEGYSAREIGRAVDRTASTVYHVLTNELTEDEMKNFKKIRGRGWGKEQGRGPFI